MSPLGEETCKRLLAAMELGIMLMKDAKFRWIIVEEGSDGFNLDEALEKAKKGRAIYKHAGNLLAALDHIDTKLAEIQRPSLLETFEKHGGLKAWGFTV